jgi:hypothetical protein
MGRNLRTVSAEQVLRCAFEAKLRAGQLRLQLGMCT